MTADAAPQPKRDTPPGASDALATARAERYSARVLPADTDGLSAYAAFSAGSIYSPPQSPLWASAWLEGTGEDSLIALLHRNGVPVLGLALEVVNAGPFRYARFAGGQHANGNFPALHPDSAADAGTDAEAIQSLMTAIRHARPDIDMLALERQQKAFQGFSNPVLVLPHTTSPNVSLAVDLAAGFDALFKGGSGRRRRKRHRSQIRKMEAAGGYRRFAAASAAEINELLDLFFALKRTRLTRMGIPDLFGAPRVQESFRRLFHAALCEPRPPFILHGLEVDGKVRAITGSSRTREGVICEFSTFSEDELSHASPGDFLFHENIAEACAEGLSVYDFSVGDEPYKRIWCDVETTHVDVFVGLTAKGRMLAAANFALAAAKRLIKQHSSTARLLRRARRISASAEE